MTEHGSFVEAGSRVVRALVAVPRWIMALVRPDRSRRRRSGVVWTVTDLLLALVATVAAIVSVFALARAIYYPFWAAGASREELERSWGGPSAIGATLVHWLVAAVTIVVLYGVVLATERLSGQSR